MDQRIYQQIDRDIKLSLDRRNEKLRECRKLEMQAAISERFIGFLSVVIAIAGTVGVLYISNVLNS